MFDFWCWVGLIVFIIMAINYKKHHKKGNDKNGKDLHSTRTFKF